jgi:hypothetical protein
VDHRRVEKDGVSSRAAQTARDLTGGQSFSLG